MFIKPLKYAVDLGTANTIIICENKVVVNEPSIVAIDIKSEKMICVGKDAQTLLEKGDRSLSTIRFVRPLCDMLGQNVSLEHMVYGFLNRCPKSFLSAIRPQRVLTCAPASATSVELRYLSNAFLRAGVRKVNFVLSPLAAAVGMGLNIFSPHAQMIVDIGGTDTEMVVIRSGEILLNRSINIAGEDMTEVIEMFIRSKFECRPLNSEIVEDIKQKIGSAMVRDNNQSCKVLIKAMRTSAEREVLVSFNDIAFAVDNTLKKIEYTILSVLELTLPTYYSDIVNNGIYITGGGALLSGLVERFSANITIPFHLANEPLLSVANGLNIIMKSKKYQFLLNSI